MPKLYWQTKNKLVSSVFLSIEYYFCLTLRVAINIYTLGLTNHSLPDVYLARQYASKQKYNMILKCQDQSQLVLIDKNLFRYHCISIQTSVHIYIPCLTNHCLTDVLQQAQDSSK
jgi:hypothetical protein